MAQHFLRSWTTLVVAAQVVDASTGDGLLATPDTVPSAIHRSTEVVAEQPDPGADAA